MKKLNVKGAMPTGDQVIEPVEITISGHFGESLDDLQLAGNMRGFKADAAALLSALRSLPGGTFSELLILMLQERASHFIVSFDQPKNGAKPQSTEPEELPASPLEASAPEMLAKLEEIERVISEWPPLHEGGDYLHGWILNSTRDVIAKAKGGAA